MKNNIYLDTQTGDFVKRKATNNGVYLIYSQHLAGYLMMHGIPLIRTVPDKRTPNRNNFIFLNSEKLQDLIDKWQIDRLKNS